MLGRSGSDMSAMLTLLLSAIALIAQPGHALDNGLALTPPMGWNTWNRYGCSISSSVILDNARALVESGLHKAGYNYIIIDDCWQAKDRDPKTGGIPADEEKFPEGLKGVVDEIHKLGLRAGIYSSAGYMTCGKRLGSLDHEEVDAKSWAEAGFDALKYDNCFSEGRFGTAKLSFDRYKKMTDALNATGRPILHMGCNWGQDHTYLWGDKIFNTYRMSGDIYDDFNRPDVRCPCETAFECADHGLQGFKCSLEKIVNMAAPLLQKNFPGFWADLDMLEVGNGGMSRSEYITHFTLWSMFRSPLILGNDLTSMSAETRAILTNPYVISLSQSTSGSSAYLVSSTPHPKSPPSPYTYTTSPRQHLNIYLQPLDDGQYAYAAVNFSPFDWKFLPKVDDIFVDEGWARDGREWAAFDLWKGANWDTGGWGERDFFEQEDVVDGEGILGESEVTVQSHGTRVFRLVQKKDSVRFKEEAEIKRVGRVEGLARLVWSKGVNIVNGGEKEAEKGQKPEIAEDGEGIEKKSFVQQEDALRYAVLADAE